RWAYDASGPRRGDALKDPAGRRLAAIDRADAEGHSSRHLRDRRGRRGGCRLVRSRNPRARRRGDEEEARRLPPQADRRRPQGAAAQAVTEEVRRAAEILRRGGLVAFPTETVYGLGADASNPSAVKKLYAVKR